MAYPNKVFITDVGPRDGLQIEPKIIPTETKIELINGLLDAGVPGVEFGSFVSPRAVPQMADSGDVFNGVKGSRRPGTKLVALVPNAKGAARAAELGVDEIKVFVSASESHNRKNINRSVDDSIRGFEAILDVAGAASVPVSGAVSTSFGCPFEGDIATAQVVAIATRMAAIGMHEIGLADTTGMATPTLVHDVASAVREQLPDMPLALHFHNTRGLGLVNVCAGLELGIDRYESSYAGLGGCPFAPGATGNICTEDLVNMLHELGIETGIDLTKLCALAQRVEQVIGRQLAGQVMRAGPRLTLHPLDDVATAAG